MSKGSRVNVFYSYPIDVTAGYHFFAQSGSGLTRISVRGLAYWIMGSTGLRVNVFYSYPIGITAGYHFSAQPGSGLPSEI